MGCCAESELSRRALGVLWESWISEGLPNGSRAASVKRWLGSAVNDRVVSGEGSGRPSC